MVVLHTNNGDITIELYPDKAPVSVANFLNYARSGFYNGTIFHRVIKRFMIQGGGFTQELVKKNTKAPIINESKNGLHNDRWSIAMARTNDPDSATAQFYINVAMNSQLDSRQGNPGYAVFGMVIDGQYAVKAIEKIATQAIGIHANVPVQAVIIQSVDIQ
ncbi:MAG: peptidylprolyl isomerase [Spongiibacteraceae bacterium]|nr:peptidylprolyl isomerase [Spongiibacteraceae bacterium]